MTFNVKRSHPIPIENTMPECERKQWLGLERYFRYSWTHAFFNWKRHRIMAGENVRTALLKMPFKIRRVMELGCGSGDGLFDMYDMSSDIEGIQWFGLDLNYSQISDGMRRSRFRVSERNMQSINFLAADLINLPLADASLDMLLCCEVVEHLPDPQIALAEMARILKPGGYAFITTPNPDNLVEQVGYTIDKLTRGSLKRLFWAGHDEISAPAMNAVAGLGHVSVYPFKIWRNWLEKAGLEVIQKVRGPMVFGGPFFDRHFFISGLMIALDPILDRLPGRFLLSNSLGLLCCKQPNNRSK
jgi:ubiquinone/menaquinone biosynthesis C-methylase UbiE